MEYFIDFNAYCPSSKFTLDLRTFTGPPFHKTICHHHDLSKYYEEFSEAMQKCTKSQTLTLAAERMTFESNYTLKRRNHVRVWEQMG